MVHPGVESEGVFFRRPGISFRRFVIVQILNRSLLFMSPGSGAQLCMICDALISHLTIFGAQLLFWKSSQPWNATLESAISNTKS